MSKKLDQLGKNRGMAKQVDQVSASLKGVQAQMTAIDKFMAAKSGFSAANTKFREMQVAVERAARAMKAGEGPTKQLARDYERAQRAVSNAAKAFESQRTAFAGARRALEGMGIPARKAAQAQDQLRAAVERTNAALVRQERFGRTRQIAGNVAGTVGMLGGLAAGYQTRNVAKKAVTSAAEFDIAVRKQRELTEGNISRQTQADILIPQAKRIGQETQFTNIDVVQAQTASMQGLPTGITGQIRAEVAAGIMENVKHYAIAMETDLKQAAETVRTYLQTTGKDISTKEKALRESQLAVNRIMRMAKLGGMSADDVPQYLKYGAGANSVVGVSEDAFLSIGALARRGGIPGQEAGVFMRQVAGKLAAPTKKGRSAMLAAGINYDNYIRMPDRLDVGRLETQFKQDIGISFNDRVRKRLEKVLSDPAAIEDRGAFTEAVTKATSSLFPVTKKGKIAASDRAKIAKAAGTFHNFSAQSIDAQGLLDKLMASNLSLAQINSIFDYRQGGRFAVTQRMRDEYNESRGALRETDNDPNFAKSRADEIMAGLGGALENLKGSIENLTLSIGEANEGLLKVSFDKLGNAFDWLSNLPKPVMQGASLTAGGLGLAAGGMAMYKLWNGFGLSASAVALDGAAAALTGAAVTLKGGGVAAGAAGAGGAAAAGGAAGGAAGWGARLAAMGGAAVPFLTNPITIAGGVAVGGLGGARLINYLDPEGASQEATLRARNAARRRGGMVEAFNSDRARLGLPSLGAAPAWPAMVSGGQIPTQAQLTGSAEVRGEASLKVEVQASSNLLQIVETMRQVPIGLSGMYNANGPGSTGKSSPDAAAPQNSWGGAVGPR
ncbi:MAG TPA: phage tail tape measure protein [Xanthobacteraceae bacterium]|nr:phage tail tape measure protein [Xanthobacteraceae bacterium]